MANATVHSFQRARLHPAVFPSHLTGYALSMDDFNSSGSCIARPRSSEYGRTPGIEVTTGPLGQGFANGVGMAIAQKRWRQDLTGRV